MSESTEILRVLVGSHAHGLATPESDVDHRGVFVTPTRELLSWGGNTRKTLWHEGESEDVTSHEVGHFLFLATKSNPTILEVFTAPVVEGTVWGSRLRALLQYVWSSKGVHDAFLGYAHNQQKKLLDDRLPEVRRQKFAATYLRVLWQGAVLLETGVLQVSVEGYPVLQGLLKAVRMGQLTTGEVIDQAGHLQRRLELAYQEGPNKETLLEPLNEFLLKLRRSEWDGGPGKLGWITPGEAAIRIEGPYR